MIRTRQEQRARFRLDGIPKKDVRERVMHAWATLAGEGHNEDEIKVILSNSPAAWQRYKAWRNELIEKEARERGMTASGITKWYERHVMTPDDQRSLRAFDATEGWGFLAQQRRKGVQRRLRDRNVKGQDLNDWKANVHYLSFMEHRDLERARRRLQEEEQHGQVSAEAPA